RRVRFPSLPPYQHAKTPPTPSTGGTVMRSIITALVLALSATAAQAKLELRDVQASHGQFGPERKSAEYVAGDQVYFRYTAAGVRTDEQGRVRAQLRLTGTNPTRRASG